MKNIWVKNTFIRRIGASGNDCKPANWMILASYVTISGNIFYWALIAVNAFSKHSKVVVPLSVQAIKVFALGLASITVRSTWQSGSMRVLSYTISAPRMKSYGPLCLMSPDHIEQLSVQSIFETFKLVWPEMCSCEKFQGRLSRPETDAWTLSALRETCMGDTNKGQIGPALALQNTFRFGGFF